MFKNSGILLPKLFWTTVRKKCSSDREQLKKLEADGWKFAKKISVTRTIYSNSESSEHFFGNRMLLPGGFSCLKNSNSNWKQLLGFRNMQKKLEKICFSLFLGWIQLPS